MTDDEVWKRRLMAYTFVRMLGLAIFFLGIAIAYGNLLRPGGWPQVGAIVAIAAITMSATRCDIS